MENNQERSSDCPVFRPSKKEFSEDFASYVARIFRKYPDLGMFKVVPPPGWSPRAAPYPPLSELKVSSPIKQMALGSRGLYQCVLVEQKDMTFEEFNEKAEAEGFKPSEKVSKGDIELMERSFWSGVSTNSPFYGADTPLSLFDDRLPYGWNLRHLSGCLLRTSRVPHIPGVTTPMVYVGMYRSFFSWHTEDLDLYSINYLHWGAPKCWYCIPPSHRKKFEDAMRENYPDFYKECRAFLRHKNIMVSPAQLKTLNIRYSTARQEPGEFVVLNAGAYHCGFNTGFNCAEAINFATEEWIPQGAAATRCHCRGDTVDIDMRIFGWHPSDSDGDTEGEEGGSESEDASPNDSEEEEGEEEEEEEEEAGHALRRRRVRPAVGRGGGAAPSRPHVTPSRAPAKRARVAADPSDSSSDDGHEQPRWATRSGRRRTDGVTSPMTSPSTDERACSHYRAGPSAGARGAAAPPRTGKILPRVTSPMRRPTGPDPVAVVTRGVSGDTFFALAQPQVVALRPPSRGAAAPVAGPSQMLVSWLRESRTDGLFRPARPSRYWVADENDLYRVRTTWDDDRGGWRLLTLRSRILGRAMPLVNEI